MLCLCVQYSFLLSFSMDMQKRDAAESKPARRLSRRRTSTVQALEGGGGAVAGGAVAGGAVAGGAVAAGAVAAGAVAGGAASPADHLSLNSCVMGPTDPWSHTCPDGGWGHGDAWFHHPCDVRARPPAFPHEARQRFSCPSRWPRSRVSHSVYRVPLALPAAGARRATRSRKQNRGFLWTKNRTP